MNTITLDIQNGTWVAIFSGPHAKHIVDLFGTDTVPTPFAGSTLPYVVFNEVASKNPNCKVKMRGDSY